MSTSDPATNATAPVGALVPRPPAAPPPPRHLITSGPPVFWSNIDTKTPEGKALVVKCHGDPDLKSDDVLNQEIEAMWLLAHPAEVHDQETGEIRDCVRTVIVAADGTTTSFVSEGILRMMKVICALYGEGPWQPALRVKVKQIKTRAARRTFTLEVLGLVGQES